MPAKQDVFFESLYRNNVQYLMKLAMAKLHDSYAAEEVTQDTFYTALQKLETIRELENPKPYLKKILFYKIQEYRRARNRYFKKFLALDFDQASGVPAPSNPIPISISGIMEAARNALSEEDWYLLTHHILKGETHMQIAMELNIDVWASQKRMQRIRDKLKEILPEY